MGYYDSFKGFASTILLVVPDVESFNAKFFEDGDYSGSSKVKDIVFDKERQAVSIPILLKRLDNTSVGRNLVEILLNLILPLSH